MKLNLNQYAQIEKIILDNAKYGFAHADFENITMSSSSNTDNVSTATFDIEFYVSNWEDEQIDKANMCPEVCDDGIYGTTQLEVEITDDAITLDNPLLTNAAELIELIKKAIK